MGYGHAPAKVDDVDVVGRASRHHDDSLAALFDADDVLRLTAPLRRAGIPTVLLGHGEECRQGRGRRRAFSGSEARRSLGAAVPQNEFWVPTTIVGDMAKVLRMARQTSRAPTAIQTLPSPARMPRRLLRLPGRPLTSIAASPMAWPRCVASPSARQARGVVGRSRSALRTRAHDVAVYRVVVDARSNLTGLGGSPNGAPRRSP